MRTETKKRRGVKRYLAVLPGAAALVALASTPASAAQWNYDIRTTDSVPGGQAIGRVSYEGTGGGCYRAGIDGYLYDREADGYGAIVYLRGRDCRTGKVGMIEAGYIGGNGKSTYYNTGWIGGLKDVTARVCLFKDNRDHFCRTA
ncbi:hypothetical protein ACFQVC_28790 [Streptomyces monticola]|uniref:Spore-associated protein A n=1 Tax=Streptomyces monticola TaxID=2666263 RepID=A0ABW2JR33_9ACTN